MNSCLIAIYGGTTKWIDLTIRNHPDIAWIIILSNSAQEADNDPNRYADAMAYVKQLRLDEDRYPQTAQRRFNVINIPKLENYGQTYSFFRSLFLNIMKENVSKFFLQIDSGPMIWRICLYQCGEEFHDKTARIFIYNKLTAKEEPIRIFRELNDVEQNVLKILQKKQNISLSELKKEYDSKFSGKSLSYLLKVVNRLSLDGFTVESKEGREKIVSLSEFGEQYFSQDRYNDNIRKELAK